MVGLAHKFLGEVLSFGDRAVDLTAGGGRDALFLAGRTGSAGRVYAFDIQQDALRRTEALLREHGLICCYLGRGEIPGGNGVFLVNDGHQRVASYVREPVQAVIANLGYLPQGDKRLVTCSETTLQALQDALPLLSAGGRLAVIAYVGHPGGRQEADRITDFFGGLPPARWKTMKTRMLNREQAPLLLMAEKL